MKKVFLTICYLSFAANVFAQDGPKNLADSLKVGWWDPRSTQFGINVSQAGFNDAWSGAQGSVGSMAIGFIFNNKAQYHKNKGVFSTDAQFQYGSLKNKGQEARKSIDRIFLDAKYASRITPKLNWFVGANFISQFAPGFAYDAKGVKGKKIANLFAPGFLSEGVGLEWKPVKHFVLQLGGATMRQTFVSDAIVFANTQKEVTEDGTKLFRSYGVEKGKKMLNELGFQIVAAYDKDIAKNVNLKWRYQGFVAYLPKTKPMDHNISAVATAKVNKYLNVNFTVLGIYDADIVKEFQFSEGLAIGFLFTL